MLKGSDINGIINIIIHSFDTSQILEGIRSKRKPNFKGG
jgi:hypothetical protein